MAEKGELLGHRAIEDSLGINLLITRDWEQGNHVSCERSNSLADAGSGGLRFYFRHRIP